MIRAAAADSTRAVALPVFHNPSSPVKGRAARKPATRTVMTSSSQDSSIRATVRTPRIRPLRTSVSCTATAKTRQVTGMANHSSLIRSDRKLRPMMRNSAAPRNSSSQKAPVKPSDRTNCTPAFHAVSK
ncbi:hypothetical protein D3C71_850060 [compost metagenome]